MTTKDVIKQLPLEDALKVQILQMYDTMEPGQKLTIQRIAWRTYDLLRAGHIDESLERSLESVKKGESHLGPDFYSSVVKKADQAIMNDSQTATRAVEIAQARTAMEQIINEIQAANKTA